MPAKGKSENELADFPGLRDMRNAEGVRDLLVVNGFPNFNLFSTNNLLAWYERNPIAYGKTNLKGHTMLHRGVAGVLAENAKRAIVENFTSIHREDLIAIEGP